MPDQPEMSPTGLQGPSQGLPPLPQAPPAAAIQAPPLTGGFLDRFAVGLAGLGPGMRGQENPALAQRMGMQREQRLQQNMQAQQQDTAFQRQMQLARFQQSRLDRQAKQSELGMSFAREMLGSSDADVRKAGAQMSLRYLKQLDPSFQPPPGFVESFGTSKLSADQRKAAYISSLAGASDDYLTKTYGISPQDIPAIRQEAASPAVHKMLYGKSPFEEQREIEGDKLKQQAEKVKEDRLELDRQKAAAAEAKGDRQHAETMARIAQADRRLRIAEDALALNQAKFDFAQTKASPQAKADEKAGKALDHAELFTNQMESYANTLNQDGFLPKTSAGVVGGLLTGDPSAALAKQKRFLNPNDPTWVAFTKHLKGEMVGYTRSVQNDIGPRAMAAFQSALQLMDDPPSFDAIKKVTTTMRQAITLARDGKDTAQFVYIKHPNGQVGKVPWKRGMTYEPADTIVKVE